MMKHVAYLSAVVALLVFGGCSKEPTIDATANSSVSGSASGTAAAQKSATDSSAVIAPITNASAADKGTSGSDAASNANTGAIAGITSISFDYDKFNIREDMQAPLKVNAGLLKNKTVKLEGNCDEFGSDEYNFALGLKRTNAVKSVLVSEGVNADSITMISLGEGNPVCMEKTQECWAKNRRVDFKLP